MKYNWLFGITLVLGIIVFLYSFTAQDILAAEFSKASALILIITALKLGSISGKQYDRS